MDGIAVLESMAEANLPSRVIVLSCHDEFDFVHDALKLGAVDYLLKHRMKPEQILDILQGAMRISLKKLDFSVPEVTGIPFESGTDGAASEELAVLETLMQSSSPYSASPPGEGDHIPRDERSERRLACAVFEIDHATAEGNGFGALGGSSNQSAVRRFSNLLEAEDIHSITKLGPSTVASLIEFHVEDENLYAMKQQVYDVCVRIRRRAVEHFGYGITVGLSPIVPTGGDTRELAQRACEALWNRYYCGKNGIFFAYDTHFTTELSTVYSKLHELSSMAVNREAGLRVFGELFDEIRERKIFPPKLAPIFTALLHRIRVLAACDAADNSCCNKTDVVPPQCATIAEHESWFVDGYCQAVEMATAIEGQARRLDIRLALGFVHKNYCNNFTLTDVARYVGRSPSYLSRLFKAETGERFSTFLAKHRIEKARELLEGSDLKVAAVALEVGYRSSYHFYHVFKEHTGMTPNEYRKRFTSATGRIGTKKRS